MTKYGFFQEGASLIDILIALAIVAVLMSIGMPVYQTQIKQAERKAIQREMLKYVLRQESFRLTHYRYATAKEIPIPEHEDFNIQVSNLSEQTYRVFAKAKVKMKRRCGDFSIDQKMQRSPAACW